MYANVTGILLFSLFLMACGSDDESNPGIDDNKTPVTKFYAGADLSYVNEMEDCGAQYYNRDSDLRDPYSIFADAGMNIVQTTQPLDQWPGIDANKL